MAHEVEATARNPEPVSESKTESKSESEAEPETDVDSGSEAETAVYSESELQQNRTWSRPAQRPGAVPPTPRNARTIQARA